MRGLTLMLAFTALAACASRHPAGNAQGGVVTPVVGGDAQVAAAAQAHCARFGKNARLGRTLETGSVMFDCVW
ncbi:MAG: hypothetical protein KIT36_02600 [Alphaproteobacteria bacterium]|nr:hypothetical protein [Alphaproteobacteria bacterium]